VRALGGSAHARGRLEAILETVTGNASVREACERLGVKETAFYRMRTSALEAARERLEPKPMGRPPRLRTEADRRIAELEAEIERLKKAVATSQVREELALAMPFLADNRKWREQFEEPRGEKGRDNRHPGPGAAGDERTGSGPTGAGRTREPQGAEARRTDEGCGGGEGAAEGS
jgi:transposase-like protein